MSTLTPHFEASPPMESQVVSRLFHVEMASACLILTAIAFLGSHLASIRVEGIGIRITVVMAMTAMIAPIPAYWHEKQRLILRDSALMIPWMFLLATLLPFPILIGARLRMPLQDSLFAHIDGLLGVNVPGIMAWATRHGLDPALTASYYLLGPLLLAAIFAPALAGKLRYAKEFLLSNVIALSLGSLLFAALPAIGPWSYYHFPAGPQQLFCQAQLLALRHPGVYPFFWQGVGIVCFPSFHVVWAVLCAAALWGFRPLRILVAPLSGIIVLSTMTTGWHYFTDVVAGFILAAASLALAKFFMNYRQVSTLRENHLGGPFHARNIDARRNRPK